MCSGSASNNRREWSYADQNRLRHLFAYLANQGLTTTAPQGAIKFWMEKTPHDSSLDSELGRTIGAIGRQIVKIDERIRAGLFSFTEMPDDDYHLDYLPGSRRYAVTKNVIE